MGKIENLPNISNYELTFKVAGLSFLFTDMLTKGFKYLHPLFTSSEDGNFRQYFTNGKMEYAGKYGINWLSKEGEFIKYKLEFTNYHDVAKKELNTILSRKQLSESSLLRSFRLLARVFTYYSKMDFQFTNLAYLYKSENPTLAANLNLLGEFKDIARVWVNEIALSNDSEFNRLLFKIENQFGIGPSSLENYKIEELKDLFYGKQVPSNIIEKRQFSYTIYVAKNQVNYLVGRESSDYINEIGSYEDEQVSTMLKGQVANKTAKRIIKGKARVINVDYSDLSNMNDEMDLMEFGEILISEFTAPELMTAIEKSIAIVTDLGGMLSHAAIISREKGIPCLVATKSASKAFKDGDNLILDTNKGIVMLDD